MFFLAQEGEAHNPLLPAPAELVVGTISFAIVLLLVGWKLVPQIQKTLAERTDAIEGGLKRAEEAQRKAQETLEQYQAQLAEARTEAARLREKAREEGAQIVAEMREQAQAEARRIVESAQATIEAERQQALQQLRAEVGALSVELAGRIVGEALTDQATQSRVVDRFLAELEDRTRTQEPA
ncbi:MULTISPECIES: F0F1 ATP synthase subunit B [Thermomonospora]|uniref:ATP synthase subunit b n=1 Tax=Thermomonospora cellulosilytica TaxID=1411118 RepID=A0A7W3RCA1_9ACTN|nr:MULTISPECIES: F0F1 ATP synthase subunit B [Thermomonospora]MBA9007711.1 F-type H+-transporting ATPase subunit b [Thermomonospora cellulosilytica]